MNTCNLINENFIKETSKLIEQRLIEAAVNRELIEVNEFTRCLGKTTALIKFAKRFNFGVVLNLPSSSCEQFKKDFCYDSIFSVRDYSIRGTGLKVVVDELVNVDELKRNEIKVITGFKYRS